MSTEGTKKCKIGVKGMTVSRSGYTVTAKWSVPSDMTKSGSKRKALKLGIVRKGSYSYMKLSADKGTGTTSASINLNSFTYNSKTYTRASFYPVTNTKLTLVSWTVTPKNKAGDGTKPVSRSYVFKIPRVPTISAPTVDASNGQISCTISTNAGTDEYERYDTEAKRVVHNTRTGNTSETNITHSTTSYTDTYDASDYQQLSYDDYIMYRVCARSRGLAGASAWQYTKDYYLSYPQKATIENIDVSSVDSTGKVTVVISTNQTKEHPVDKVVLETLADVEYTSASQIPAGASWTVTDSVDDGECTALAASVQELIPDAGKHTWVRIKSVRAIEGVLYRYSEPQRIIDLETPAATAQDESITIIDARSGADGESADVQLAWNASGTDDADGTELTWSEDANAWRSTDDPDNYEFAWSDGSYTDTSVTPNVTYQDSADITIKGLDSGVPVYIRARRYKDGDTRTYSPYSVTKMTIPSAAPIGVTLSAEKFVPQGSPIACEWTFGGGGVQRSWVLYCNGSPIDKGTGTTGHYEIPADTVAKRADDGELELSVEVSTGGDPATSNTVTVTIQEPPTLSVTTNATLTAQPVAFTALVSEPCTLSYVLSSGGVSGQTDSGVVNQLEGTVIWSDTIQQPIWTAVTGGYSATVTLPIRETMEDGARYMLSVTATSSASGLESNTSTSEIAVNWAHKAPYPDEYATVTPSEYTDADGMHHITAQIDLQAVVGSGEAASTDVFDIYRLTADGASLIGLGYPLECSVTDEYAPFGTHTDLAYRIAIRTADGDTSFADIEYQLPGDYMRLDWLGGWLELPYNIAISDAYAKDVEVRKHADGTSAAYYNNGVTRTGKLSSVIIRADGADDVERARALANYSGAMFVRTPDGSAYEADVQVSDMNTDGVLLNLSLSTNRVAETAAYMLPPIAEEEEQT